MSGDTLRGRRRPQNTPDNDLEPGDYAKHNDFGGWGPDKTFWSICNPVGEACNVGCPSQDDVTEHEDGTITVGGSIFYDRWPSRWHGYLERGLWREC